MSGRGSGRGQRGWGWGGWGYNWHRCNHKKPEKEKRSLKDHNYYISNRKQASDYKTMTEFIMNHVKKTCNHGRDIIKALKELEPINQTYWVPQLQVSAIQWNDANSVWQQEAEDRHYELMFKQDLSRFWKHVDDYEDNLTKAHALIWERCMKACRTRLWIAVISMMLSTMIWSNC